jgi:hypothetical protein
VNSDPALDGLTVVTRNGMRRVMVALLILVVIGVVSSVVGVANSFLAYRQTRLVEELLRDRAPTGCQPCPSSTMPESER